MPSSNFTPDTTLARWEETFHSGFFIDILTPQYVDLLTAQFEKSIEWFERQRPSSFDHRVTCPPAGVSPLGIGNRGLVVSHDEQSGQKDDRRAADCQSAEPLMKQKGRDDHSKHGV